MPMFPGVARQGLTLTKVLGGINKTLNVANQLIPLYMQAKPIIQNAKSAFTVAKEIMTPDHKENTTQKNANEVKSENVPKIKEETYISSNNTSGKPVFFV